MKTRILLTVFPLLLALSAHAQFSQGHYYTYDGQKITGELRHMVKPRAGSGKPDNCFEFKSSGGKKTKITTTDARALVLGTDSFAVIRDFDYGGQVKYSEDFVKVIVSGKVMRVMHYNTVDKNGKADGTHLYLRDGKVMPLAEALKGNEEMQIRVQEYRLADDELNALIRQYNSGAGE